ncbi:unnamed protein product [Cylindrotheca closterium]|uniref:CRAL/TRIO N-terminal domain-containing protein n=1 Tax=Cylindrotheca closterium TaxID=2856 RepID=A0AAD2JLU1_9STRA|nr:unnamed protein product [Cylindrotheca closterium]
MIVEDDEGIIYPYYNEQQQLQQQQQQQQLQQQQQQQQLQQQQQQQQSMSSANQGRSAMMQNQNMMAPPSSMGAVPPNDDMVCAAMCILLCPPHEGIAREYHELPPMQQSEVWNDLTGNQAASNLQQEESPEMIQQAFRALMEQVEKIPDSQKSAFVFAMNTYPQFVLDPAFLLRFLRAERFDPELTAERLVLHFTIKQELFGNEKLGREIVLQDLQEDPDDWDCMERGFLQVLSKRDFSGRLVIFFYKAISGCYRRRENVLRMAWYMYNKVAQSPENQKVGVINLVYNIGGFPEGGMDYEKSRRFGQVIKSMPLRVEGMFVCLDEAPWLAVVEAFSMMVTKFLRIRLRALPGSHTECMYQLMSLGLPQSALPVHQNSQLRLEYHRKWLQEQHQQERERP